MTGTEHEQYSATALEPYTDALRMVQDAIKIINEKLATKVFNSADLCRLINLEIELKQKVDEQSIKEVKVTWVDPDFSKER